MSCLCLVDFMCVMFLISQTSIKVCGEKSFFAFNVSVPFKCLAGCLNQMLKDTTTKAQGYI